MLFNPKLDLKLEREVSIAPDLIWKAWTTPELLVKWFCPPPWKTVECEIDLKPGGLFKTVMRSPEGELFPNMGCYLEVIPGRKLTWTDALLPDYRPVVQPESGAGFLFTASIFLEPTATGTKYTAICYHKDEKDRETHANMGFENGWSICLDQLIEVMTKK
jgi:uncharacterized protein YndB with AHSA1/START domain